MAGGVYDTPPEGYRGPGGLSAAALEELRQKLAAIEHERWADWQRHVHSLGRRVMATGSLVLPGDRVAAWQRQIDTPYAELSADEKARDLREVDRYWPLVLAAIAAARGG